MPVRLCRLWQLLHAVEYNHTPRDCEGGGALSAVVEAERQQLLFGTPTTVTFDREWWSAELAGQTAAAIRWRKPPSTKRERTGTRHCWLSI